MTLPLCQVDCPNQDQKTVPVEFLVLHYTATDLSNTLRIFQDARRGVSAHLVIDVDGIVYSLVDCLEGEAHRAWHAGQSRYDDGVEKWTGFNDFSIGIELVNFNGNLFPFTDAQYQSLAAVVLVLKQHYPALLNPDRVLGHEQIAGYRGKVDPGSCFDWARFWQMCYPDVQAPDHQPACPGDLQKAASDMIPFSPDDLGEKAQYWMRISSLIETAVKLANSAGTD